MNRARGSCLRDLERHGYLDERHFFLGNDDHDFHRRLFQAEGRRPLRANSLHAPLAREPRRRTGVNRLSHNVLRAEKRGSPAFHGFLDSSTFVRARSNQLAWGKRKVRRAGIARSSSDHAQAQQRKRPHDAPHQVTEESATTAQRGTMFCRGYGAASQPGRLSAS